MSMNERQMTAAGRTFSPKLIGAMFMLLWALTFSTAMAFTKILSPDVDSFIILFMRDFFGLLFFSPFVAQAGFKGFKTSRPVLQLIRVFCILIAMGCTYYAYRHLPLALATSIGMTGPLFTTLLAMLLLKDAVTVSKWALILFGYFGVVVMVRPHDMPIGMGVWVELFANLFAAFAIICTKLLSRTDSTLTTMLYTTTITTFIAGILALSVWKTPSFPDLMVLVAIGAFGVFSQYCSITALRYANPSYLAPFEYTRMCFAIPVGFFFFEEFPTLWTLFGCLMIIGATYGLTRLELRSNISTSAA
jgi:drug/metabolite transporter (DMT)-like permease